MSYLALYRKWRPGTFAEVVGQPHVVGTLHNALRAGKASHAYLFCGSRGTGKTSMAKILAKALNCTSMVDGEPCNLCASCVKINEGRFMDILEIDAASNRGIDEMRDLREKINMAPAEGIYKVYIIDEVHMLTPEAFNALLKTLEEPPAHVVFVLATTEPHKIPLTILSRCQRFEFHRIGVEEIVGRLREIVAANQVEAEPEALQLIAKLAQGGLRDALSLLDQCLSSDETRLTLTMVADVAGVAGDEWMARWMDGLIQGDAGTVLMQLQEALRDGKQSGQILSDLISYLRNMLVLSLGTSAEELVAVPPDIMERLKDQGERLGSARMFGAVERLSVLSNELKYGSNEQILLETGLIRLCRMLVPLETEGLSDKEPVIKIQSNDRVEQPRTKDTEPDREKEDAVAAEIPDRLPLAEQKPYAQEQTPGGEESEEPLPDVLTLWEQVKNSLKEEKKLTTLAFVVEGQPIIEDRTLWLRFSRKYEFHKSRSEKPDTRREIEEYLYKACGQKLGFECRFLEESTEEHRSEQGEDLLETIQKVFGTDKVEIMKEE